MKKLKRNNIFVGFVFALMTTILLGMVLFSYIFGAGDNSFMNVASWIYYFFSSIMHASLFILLPFAIVFLPLSLMGLKNKINIPLLSIIYVFIVLISIINRFVFQIYHFHINGFVLDMLFSEGAGDIFVFSFWLYAKAILIFICVCLAIFCLYRLSAYITKKTRKTKKVYLCSLYSFIGIIILSQGIHIYGAATMKTSILECNTYLPYYFPISMNSTLDKWGIIDKKQIANINFKDKTSPLSYPINKLTSNNNKISKPNIVIIAIDSWNYRTMTKECMPNVWEFKEKAEYFSNHLSSRNGTRGGIFGLFTGLSSYYWKSFEYSSLKPIFIEQLQKHDYKIQIYPSATFQSPPFDRMFFKGMKDINTSTKGRTVYERDCNITNNFISDLPKYKKADKPFFAFLFYDMAHAISIPKEKNNHFLPAWDYADYSKLTNNTDPLPFYNLYRNCIYQIDSLVAKVLNSLKENNLLDNTIILITGDHGQEFNENKKNYWGHSGNYTKYQIQVPLILYYPKVESKTFTHRTTHYDIVPTLLHKALGINNSPKDYSMGEYLHNKSSRGWHVVGNDLNYAFITEEGYIIEKEGNGYVKVYDKNLNLQKNYKLSPKLINENLLKLNRFFK